MNFILPLLPVALSGWVCGALVNYLSDVLPVCRRFVHPFCLDCRADIRWGNYLFWPRRCAACHTRRKLRVWIVELFFVAASIWIWLLSPQVPPFALSLLVLVYLGVVTVIDIEYRVILHPVSLAGAALGLAVGSLEHGLWRTLAGGAFGFLAMLGLYWVGLLFLRIQRRRQGLEQPEDALGFGDVNLGGVIGLMIGWPGIIAGLVLAVLIAGGFSLAYLLIMLARREYQPSLAIPYGPFLALSAAWLLIFRGAPG